MPTTTATADTMSGDHDRVVDVLRRTRADLVLNRLVLELEIFGFVRNARPDDIERVLEDAVEFGGDVDQFGEGACRTRPTSALTASTVLRSCADT